MLSFKQTSTQQVTIYPTATTQAVPNITRRIEIFPSNVPHTHSTQPRLTELPTSPSTLLLPSPPQITHGLPELPTSPSTLLHPSPPQSKHGLPDRTATPSNNPQANFAVPVVVLITTVLLIITAAVSAACIMIVTAVTCRKCFKKRHSKVVFQRTEPKQGNNL